MKMYFFSGESISPPLKEKPPPLFSKEISDSKLFKTINVVEAVFNKFKRSILNKCSQIGDLLRASV